MMPEQSNITNINQDCMNHIFECLELEDLLNVADTCITLRDAASQFFEWKYSGNKIVGIGPTVEMWDFLNVGQLLKTVDKEMHRKWKHASIIVPYTPSMALKLLRNFGHTIRNLHISSVVRNLMEKLGYYLVEYCCEALENLLLVLCDVGFTSLKKSCMNVESVIFFECIFYHELPFSTQFPNIKSLILYQNDYHTYFTKIAFPFPALTHFSFSDSRSNLRNRSEIVLKHQESELIELLKLNTQIEHLEMLRLAKNYSHDLLKCITKMPKLRFLAIWNDRSQFFVKDVHEEITFRSDSVESFFLISMRGLDVYHIPIVFTRLKYLTLYTGTSETFFKFISKHQEIKSIYLGIQIDNLNPQNFQFQNISLNIEELTIASINDFPEFPLFQFLKERCKLKKFSLHGRFETRNLSESCQRLCDAMISNDIQFEVKQIENVHTDTIELFIKNFNNSSQMQNIIKISNHGNYAHRPIDIVWYTINDENKFNENNTFVLQLLELHRFN